MACLFAATYLHRLNSLLVWGLDFTHRWVEGGHLTHQREEKRVDGRRVDFGWSWTGHFQHSSSLLARLSMQVRPHAIAASISFVVIGPRGLV